MKKFNFEKLFFILLNIFFILEVYIAIFLILSFILALLLPFNMQKDFFENSLQFFSKTIIICASMWIIFSVLKILIFPIIYIKSNSYIKDFFNKFRTDLKFMCKILLITLLVDIIHFVIFHNPMLIFGGLFINYFVFLIIFPPAKQEISCTDNNKIIISNYSKIMLIAFLIMILLALIGFYCYVKFKAS